MRPLLFILLLGLAAKAMPQVVYAEYFFDDASVPFRQGTSITVPENTGDVLIPVTIETKSLAPGFHQAFFRVKDAAKGWSTITPKIFMKPWPLDTMAGFKYCIDEQALGSSWKYIAFPEPATDLTYTSDLDLSEISKGIHYIRIMVCSKNHLWTPALGRTFFSLYHEPVNITALEYYFEDENENRSTLYKTRDFTPSSQVNLDSATFEIPVSSLVNLKEYFLYIRAVDETGNRGLYVKDTIVYHAPMVGITDHIYLDREMIVFPNPAEDRLNIKFISLSTNGDFYLKMYDQTGRLVMQKAFSLNKDGYYSIETKALASGTYHLIVQGIDGSRKAYVQFIKR
jgi:hypothetical protein